MGFIALSYVPYIFSILKNKTKPDRTTWLIFSFISIISFFTYKEIGANYTLGFAFANMIGSFLIFIFSIKYGEGWEELGNLKYLIFSLIAIILWQVFDSALLGLIFNLVADFFAFLPTLKKSFFRPWTEDLPAWIICTIGNAINLLAIEHWTFSIALYPVYIFLAELLLVIFLSKPFLNKFKS